MGDRGIDIDTDQVRDLAKAMTRTSDVVVEASKLATQVNAGSSSGKVTQVLQSLDDARQEIAAVLGDTAGKMELVCQSNDETDDGIARLFAEHYRTQHHG